MKERLKEFMSRMAVSAAELADRIGVQRSSISHILGGRNLPSSQFIEKLLIAYPELDAGWLITGRGNMLKTGVPASADENRKEDKKPEMSREIADVKPMHPGLSGDPRAADLPLKPPAPVERIVFFYSDRSFSEYYPEPGVQPAKGGK
jgi:transcriptional regulator with XRE-family HTH domain